MSCMSLMKAQMAAERVLGYIDSTVQRIYDELQVKPCGKPSITLKRITKLKPNEKNDGEAEWQVESRKVTYCFPGKTKDEAWRFCEKTYRSSAAFVNKPKHVC